MSDKIKHTPGPWSHLTILSASENSQGFKIIGPDWFGIATVAPLDEDGREGAANARLIAAAPDLLVALEVLVNDLGEPEDGIQATLMNAARAAIAKATGANNAP